MARGKDRAWLLDAEGNGRGAKPSRTERGRSSGGRGEATSQWLAVPDGVPPRAIGEAPERAPRKDPRNRRRLTGRLRQAERQVAARDRRIAELEEQVAELEERLAQVAKPKVKADARPKAKPRAKRSASAKGGTRKRDRAGSASPRLPLNDATFEELRELSLSVTQCARLIATREMRDGFDSFNELEELRGFPRETIALLKRELAPPRAKRRKSR